MIPLIFAAAVALSTPSADQAAADARAQEAAVRAQLDALRSGILIGPVVTANLSDFQRQLRAAQLCKQSATKTLGPDGLALKKLNELPPGAEQHAVLLMLNGCPLLEVVQKDGQVSYYEAPQGGMERDLHGSRMRRY